jgi:hypothetical protein
LFVNLNGNRFVNESFIAGDLNWITLQQPKNTFYSVVDSKILTAEPLPKVTINTSGNTGGRMVESGVPDPNAKGLTTSTAAQGMPPGTPQGTQGRQGMQGMSQGKNFIPRGLPGNPAMPGMVDGKASPEELKKAASMAGKHVVIGDSIEELADKLGIDRKTLVATVKRYNELCAKGHDDDYFKSEKYLLPIEKGPFYAFDNFLGMDGANGGLAINENMQIMGDDGPVGGLYASGDVTGSRYVNRGGDRTVIVNDNTWAAASGFLAGQNIGKQLKTS